MANNVSQVSFFGPQALGAALDPSSYANQLQLQQQQALAQGLIGEGMKPIDPNRSAGRFAVPISPLEGASKMAQTYLGSKMQQSANQQQAALAQKQMQMFMGLFGLGQPQPSATAGATTPPGANSAPGPQAQPTSQPQPPQRAPFAIPGMSPQQSAAAFMLNPQAYLGTYMKQFEPTDLQRNINAYGGQNGEQLGHATLEKGAYIAPPVVRQNSVALDPRTNQPMFANPAAAPGTTNIWQAGNPYPQQNVRIPGSLENLGAEAATVAGAQASAKTPYELTEVKLADGRTIKVPVSYLTDQNPQAPQTTQPGQQPGQVPQQRINPFGQGQTTTGEERQKGIAKSSNEYVDQLRSSASGAIEQNRMLDELDKSLQSFTPGKAAALRKAVAQWKVQIGIASDEDKTIASSAETGDKITGQLVSNALRRLSARPSQMEFQIFKDQYVPNLQMTPQGAQQVIQFMRQVNNLDAQKYEQFNQWKRSQPQDVDYRDFDLTWNRTAPFLPLGAPSSFPQPNLIKDAVNSGTQQAPQPNIVDFNSLRRGR